MTSASGELNLKANSPRLNVKNAEFPATSCLQVVGAISKMRRGKVKDPDGDIGGVARRPGRQPAGERHSRRKFSRQMPAKYGGSASVVFSGLSKPSHSPQRCVHLNVTLVNHYSNCDAAFAEEKTAGDPETR